MVNFKQFFEDRKRNSALYKINNQSCLDFYCGFDENNNYCLALKASKPFPFIESTKLLTIEQKIDIVPNTYWLYISLKDSEAKNVFFSFCNDIFESIDEKKDFDDLYVLLKNRISCWKKMFSKATKPISKEVIKGLYGELLFIDKYLSKQIGLVDAIKSWSGPAGTSKDFAFENAWYEIKTINISSPTVKISSLNQLSDSNIGYLVVIKVEETSEMYTSDWSDIITIFDNITDKLREVNDSEIIDSFFEKLAKLGFAPDEEYRNYKFRSKEPVFYLVDEHFPCLKESDIQHLEIAKISYELILKMLEKYRSEPWKL